MASDPETPSQAVSVTLWTGRRAHSGLEQALRTNTSDGLRTRIPQEPVGRLDQPHLTDEEIKAQGVSSWSKAIPGELEQCP